MAGPYHEYHEGWARLGITASEGREKGAENEGKGTGKGKGKYMWEEFREDEDVLFSQLERHVLREDSGGALARVIARVLFVYKGKAEGKGQMYFARAGHSWSMHARGKGKAEGKGEVEGHIEGGDDNNEEGGTGNVEGQTEGADDNNDEGGFVNAFRQGQARREEPPPPFALGGHAPDLPPLVALPYVPPSSRGPTATGNGDEKPELGQASRLDQI